MKIDGRGSIVIPNELRRTLGIGQNDPIAFYVDSNKIILHKCKPACVFCNSADNVTSFKDKVICGKCLEEIKK